MNLLKPFKAIIVIWTWANSSGRGERATIIRHDPRDGSISTAAGGEVPVVGTVDKDSVTIAKNMDPLAALCLGFIFRQQKANQLAVVAHHGQLLVGQG